MINYEEVFTESFRRVLGTGAYNPEFIKCFYDTFLEKSPVVAEKFAQTDMSAQRTMLHDSLLTMVDFNRTKIPSPRLQQLAEIHSRSQHDIKPVLYDLWLESLITAVARHDPDFDDDVSLAWRIALAPGICFMRFSY